MKIGDKVLCKGRYSESVTVIIGETKTCWRLQNKCLYTKDGLRLRGADVWNGSYISLVTLKDIKRVKLKNLRNATKAKLETCIININNFSEEKLISIYNLINKIEQADRPARKPYKED